MGRLPASTGETWVLVVLVEWGLTAGPAIPRHSVVTLRQDGILRGAMDEKVPVDMTVLAAEEGAEVRPSLPSGSSLPRGCWCSQHPLACLNFPAEDFPLEFSGPVLCPLQQV